MAAEFNPALVLQQVQNEIGSAFNSNILVVALVTLMTGAGLGGLLASLPQSIQNLFTYRIVRFLLLFGLVWQGGGNQEFIPSLIAVMLFFLILEVIEFFDELFNVQPRDSPPASLGFGKSLAKLVKGEQVESFASGMMNDILDGMKMNEYGKKHIMMNGTDSFGKPSGNMIGNGNNGNYGNNGKPFSSDAEKYRF